MTIRHTEGGHVRGHSMMDHWEYTEIIKAESKRLRRRQDHAAVGEQMTDFDADEDVGNRCPRCGPGPCDPEAHKIDVILLLAGLPLDTP